MAAYKKTWEFDILNLTTISIPEVLHNRYARPIFIGKPKKI